MESISVVPLCSLKLKTRSFVEWLANTWLFTFLIGLICKITGIYAKSEQFKPLTSTTSANYVAIATDMLHVYYVSRQPDRFVPIAKIKIEAFRIWSICIGNDEKYLACLCSTSTELTVRIFDLENWVELVSEFVICPLDEITLKNEQEKVAFYSVVHENEYNFVVRVGSFIAAFVFKAANNKQLELFSECKFECSDCRFIYDKNILELTSDGRLRCSSLSLETGELREIASHLFAPSNEPIFSLSSKNLFISDEEVIWMFGRNNFSLLKKVSFPMKNLTNFYAIGEDERLQIIFLSSQGKLCITNGADSNFIGKNCVLLGEQKLKQFVFGSLESFGFFSVEQYLVLSQLTARDEVDIKTDALLKGQPVLIDADFLEKYLARDPSDSQGIITADLLKGLNGSEMGKVLENFVPKSWADAREIFRLLERNEESALLDFFISFIQADSGRFQEEFVEFLNLDAMSLCKLFAVNCSLDLLDLYWDKIENGAIALDCIPEYMNPQEYLHFLPRKIPKEWIKKRAVCVYSCTGNIEFVNCLLNLIDESDLREKICFFDKLLLQLNLLEHERIVDFLSLDSTDAGFFILAIGKGSIDLFSSFISPYYDTFCAANAFELFLKKFAQKEPKTTIKMLEKSIIAGEDELLTIFWNFPHSDLGLLGRFVDFYSSLTHLNNSTKNVLEILKIFLKYKIVFSNSTEITNIGKNCQLIYDSFDRLFSRLKNSDSQDTFWLELLNDSLELWSLFEVKIDKLKIFEKYIRCILLAQSPNSVELARDVLKDCLDLHVLTKDCANSTVYSVAKESLLKIECLFDSLQVQEKLGFIKKCLALSFDHSDEISQLNQLIQVQIPKLRKYLSKIDQLSCDLNSHHLLNYSVDWILLHKILPFHPTAYQNPTFLIDEFQITDPQYRQKILVFALKRESKISGEVRYDLLEQINDPYIWNFLYSLLLQNPKDEQLFRAFVRSSPPVDLLHKIVSLESVNSAKIQLKFDQRISFLNSSPRSNLASFPKLCRLLPKSNFENSNMKFYYFCHPDLQESHRFFKETIDNQKDELLKNLNQMSPKEIYERYLSDSSFETLIPEELRKGIFQSLFTLVLTDPSLQLQSFDKIAEFTKYLDDNFLGANILNQDLMLDRAELFYYSILNYKSELRDILTRRIELIYSVQDLKHSFHLSDMLELKEPFLVQLFTGPFQQDVDFLLDFCKRIPSIHPFLDRWNGCKQLAFEEIEILICKIFLAISLPTRIEQLQNSLSISAYHKVLLQEKSALSSQILQLICIYLELNDQFTEYELLLENPICLYWMYLRRELIEKRSESQKADNLLDFQWEETFGSEKGFGESSKENVNVSKENSKKKQIQQDTDQDLIDFQWEEQEPSNEIESLIDFQWEAEQNEASDGLDKKSPISDTKSHTLNEAPSILDTESNSLYSSIQKMAPKSKLLSQLVEIERGMTKLTFYSSIQSRSQLEWLAFFMHNYQFDRDLEIVQVIYQELMGFSKQAIKHKNWFALFLTSYLLTRFPGSKSATELAYKCASLLDIFSTKDLLFKSPKSLIQQSIQTLWKQLASKKLMVGWNNSNEGDLSRSPFSNCYLNENDMIESAYCLLIEQLFENDYQLVIREMIEQSVRI